MKGIIEQLFLFQVLVRHRGYCDKSYRYSLFPQRAHSIMGEKDQETSSIILLYSRNEHNIVKQLYSNKDVEKNPKKQAKQNSEFHLLVSLFQDRDRVHLSSLALQGSTLTHAFKVNLTQSTGH